MSRPLPADRPGRPDAPGDPPAWHEIAPDLWVGDGRFPPGDPFDLVVTLDATVGAAHPPTGGRHVVVAMRDTRWEPIDRSALAIDVMRLWALGVPRATLLTSPLRASLQWERPHDIDDVGLGLEGARKCHAFGDPVADDDADIQS